jgi:imidazolonepropionase-like amidohydrolase/Tol biopolymer transport system component
MKTATRRVLTGLVLATLAIGVSLTAEAGRKGKKTAGGKEGEKKEEAKWDVSNPPGEWKTVSIDTAETTWSDVDVSPDGTTLLFDMLGDLYSVPMEGGEAKALTQGIPWDFQAKYSPDGAKIAFISDRGGADNLWIMNADGSGPRAVTEEKEHLVHNPCWSHDGEYIAAKKDFTSTRSIPAGEIWLFHSGGGGGLQLTERPNKEKDQKTMAEPSFSPDDRYVYYSQDTTPGLIWQYNKDSTGQIFVINRLDRKTGETEVVVGGPGGSIRPTPSPDGKRLAFVRRTPDFTSSLFVKEMDSGRELPVYDHLDRDLQETDGSQGITPAFAWLPGSKAIVFWAAGKFRKVDVDSRKSEVIPVHIRTTRKIQPALRFPVQVAPDTVDVKMLRWAQFSPDGSRALFQALGHLYMKDLKTGAQRRLTSQSDHFEFYPSFSRDGRLVVYTTWDDEKGGQVRIISADGEGDQAVTAEVGHYVEPRFSPDGKSVVYRKITDGYLTAGAWSNEPGIYVIPAEGGKPKRVSRSGEKPHFGAAGDRIFFSDTVEDTHLVLKSVTLEGVDERTHLKGNDVTEYGLSPDGRWIAFTEQYNAFVAPFTLTGRTVEIGSDAKSVPVKQVSRRAGEFLHWSADSSALHWSHGPILYTRELKDAFSFLKGAREKLPEPVEDGVRLGFRVAADLPRGRIALSGARIVTMRDAAHRQEVISDGTVLLRGNRIEAVGPSGEVQIPSDARRIDVAGKTIIPGLVDVHAHGAMANEEITPQQNWMQFANLAFGVTTIHDPSNDTAAIFSAAELQRTGGIVAPRIFSTGTILYGAHAPGFTAKIDSLEDARFHVRRLKEVGAISVKSYQQPRRDQRQQVIAAARELGMMVVPEGGAKFEHNMTEIVDGHTGIEHALPLATGYEDVKQLWSQSGTGYTPTLGVAYGGISGENYWYDRTDVWLDQRLMRFTPRSEVEPRSMRRTRAPDVQYNHFHVAQFAKELRDRGVSVQVGAHGQRAGLAAHWELWMLQQGGFTPWEAIRAGTIDGARYLGLDGDIGSIEPGKLADLVVIDANPLEDFRKSEMVAYTMINGRLYDASTMDQVAPDPLARRPFFFEMPGGDTIHPATELWLENLRENYDWAP